jgi:hypothetical protein
MDTLTTIIVLGTILHAAVLAFMIWFRVRRTEHEDATSTFTPCAACGKPSAGWEYDGLDPDEQVSPETGRPWSYDMSHYRALCADHLTSLDDQGIRLGAAESR